jgi:fluoride exporter
MQEENHAIGLAATLTAPGARWPLPQHLRQFLLAGFCGGFTTFSLFSLQTITFLQQGAWLSATLYASATLLLSLLALFLGRQMARSAPRRPGGKA